LDELQRKDIQKPKSKKPNILMMSPRRISRTPASVLLSPTKIRSVNKPIFEIASTQTNYLLTKDGKLYLPLVDGEEREHLSKRMKVVHN
jgi:regulator of PEP synthase PpsR (kinase-PPPase family)